MLMEDYPVAHGFRWAGIPEWEAQACLSSSILVSNVEVGGGYHPP